MCFRNRFNCRKDILGLWISERKEGARFWLNNFTEMKTED